MKVSAISILALMAASSIPAAAQAEMFNGPSAGLQAGWSQNDLRQPRTELGATTIDGSKESAVLGAMIGYDKQFGGFVLGAEAGLSFGTNDRLSSGSGTTRTTIDPKRSFDLTARAGYLLTPETLVYGRAGYTNDRIRTTFATGTGTISASEYRDGWLVGGGVERAVTQRLSARLEYRYADLRAGHGKDDRHQVLSGLVFHF